MARILLVDDDPSILSVINARTMFRSIIPMLKINPAVHRDKFVIINRLNKIWFDLPINYKNIFCGKIW